MAFDVVKNVLTKFFADVKDYLTPIKNADKSLDDLNKKQKLVQDTSKKTGKVFKSSLGEMADGLGKLIPGFDSIAGGFKKAESAAKTFGKGTKAAIASTGIGLLIIAVGELYSYFSDLKEKAPEDLSYVEKAFLSLGDTITGVFKTAEGETTSFTNYLIGYFNPALGAQAALHDKNRDAKKKDNEEWDKAIIRLKAAAAAQEDFRKRVEATEKDRQANLKKKQEERDKEARDKAEQAAKDKQYWDEREQRETEGAVTKAQTDEDAYQAALKLFELDATSSAQAHDDEEFAATSAATQAARDEDAIAASKAFQDALDLENEKEQAKYILMQAGLDLLEEQLIASFASSKNEKKNAIAMNVINTLIGIGRVWAAPGGNYYIKLAQSLALAAIGAVNGAKISKQEFEKPPRFDDGGIVPMGGGMIRGPRHSHGGVKFRVGGHVNEAEGGEYIVNRKATRKFLPQLQAINATGRFADGGMVAEAGQVEASRLQGEITKAAAGARVVMVLEDFHRANDRLDVVEDLARI